MKEHCNILYIAKKSKSHDGNENIVMEVGELCAKPSTCIKN